MRAGVPLLYAHWEGFLKNAADALSQPPVPLIHLFIERDEIIQLAEA
ncbi:MAG: hypothetical protein IZT59_10000 [Verrucomicrobia bacterium]|nr:hypothetical protein [Verrucomicrobiota bacterium]